MNVALMVLGTIALMFIALRVMQKGPIIPVDPDTPRSFLDSTGSLWELDSDGTFTQISFQGSWSRGLRLEELHRLKGPLQPVGHATPAVNEREHAPIMYAHPRTTTRRPLEAQHGPRQIVVQQGREEREPSLR